MQHTEETITDIIIDSHDIIRSIWRGWENQAKQIIIDEKAYQKKRRSTISWQIAHASYKPSYYHESPQERGARMRAHNDCIQANGYGSSYF